MKKPSEKAGQRLTNERAIALLGALNALDGYDRIIKEGDRDRVVRDFYKLGGALRLDIARNINRLQPVLADMTAARNALLKEVTGGAGFIDPQKQPDVAAKFGLAERELLEAEVAVALLPIKAEALKLDENQIPASVLAALDSILE